MRKSLVSKTVLVLGLASFFTDISSEMIYPLLPLFVTEVLKASPMSLGIIEGIAEATASLFKVWSGYLTDRSGKRRPLIIGGYCVSSIMRPLIGLTTSWWGVLVLRFFDRVGKGIRTSPRDALIADVTPPSERARAYGLHRGMDHAGSVIGPMLASLLLTGVGLELRSVFLIAAIPGLISVMILVFGLPSYKPVTVSIQNTPLKLGDLKTLDRKFITLLVAVFIFMLANASDTFLLLRLTSVGISPSEIVLIWSALSAVKALSTYGGGILADRVGHKRMLVTSWVLYGAVYLSFGFAKDATTMVVALLAYGLFFGLSEPAERALVAHLSPPGQRGISFGYFHLVCGLASFPASLLFGTLWTTLSPEAAFSVGAALAITAALVITFLSEARVNCTT